MTISRHPGPVCRTFPASRARAHDLRRSFRPRAPAPVPPGDASRALGPCSLAPAALFGARLTSVFETRCRLPTSATSRRAGNQTRARLILAGTKAMASFRFFRSSFPPSGGRATGQAAPRPTWLASLLVPPGDRVCPATLRSRRLATAAFAGCIARIDVHGSKDRAKDASPRTESVRSRHGVLTHGWREPTSFPSSAPFGHPLSSVRGPPREETRCAPPYRPRFAFQRRPAKNAAFPQTGMPFTVSTREGIVVRRRDCALRPSRRLSRSRRPHLALERAVLFGHCKITVRSPAGSVTGFGSTDAFSTRRDSRAWD